MGFVLLSAPAGAQSTSAQPAAAQSPAQPPAAEPAIGEDYRIEFAAGVWATIPSTVQYSDTENNVIGTDIDFKQQLGLSNQRFPEFHVAVRITPRQRLRGEYIILNYRQSHTLTTNLNFNGLSYAAGQLVNSSLVWNAWRAAYEYDVISSRRGYVGGTVGLNVVDISGSIATSQTSTAGVRIPMPGLGAIARVYPAERVSVTGEFGGFDLPGGSTSTHGHAIDVDAYATVNISKYVGIQGGYRVFDVSYTYAAASNTGAFTIAGPYIGGTVRY